MPEPSPQAGTSGRKHVAVRMCVICRGRFPKAGLARYVERPPGPQARDAAGMTPPHLVHDAGMRMDGRGVYVCDAPACRERFAKFAGRGRKR